MDSIDSDGDGNGDNPTNLTNTPGLDAEAHWSPDGSRIAFRSERDGNSEIYIMDADGSNLIRLTDRLGWDGAPDWSPDGTRIVFNSNQDGDFDIYAMDSVDTDNDGNGAIDNPISGAPVDRIKALNDTGLPARIDAGEVDEIWYCAPSGIGAGFESQMGGKGAFWINGGLPGADLSTRAFR